MLSSCTLRPVVLLLAVAYFSKPIYADQKLKLTGCSQSSLAWSGDCNRAIDDNVSQNYGSNSCTHTNNEMGWWSASTEKLAHIREIKIFNRIDCCSERLNNFVITVDGHECASYESGTFFSVLTFKCDKVGQLVMIKNRMVSPLTLCEVQVFGEYVTPTSGELLKLDDCYQSTTDWQGDCHRAIDGNTNQMYSSNSCSHTNSELSWWQGSMKKRAFIKEIKIFNRLDCCSDRLNNFVVTIDDKVCATYKSSNFFSVITFQCNMEGQNVFVRSLLAVPLTLCEVQVFGEYAKEPVKRTDQLSLTNCSQSSLDWAGVCTRAIDGNTNQFYFGQSCTHTKNEIGWWKASTEKKAEIKEVRIVNRVDCCSDRLNNFIITVDGQECASYSSPSAFSVQTFKCGKVGQVVEIRSRKSEYLTLCEVEVFGELVDDRPKFKLLGCFIENADMRDLKTLAASDQMSPKKCNGHCAARGFSHFALQSGNQCWCGDNYGSNGVASENDCQMACSGDSAEKCGGNLRNAVYEVDKSRA